MKRTTLLDTYLDYHNIALRSTTNAEPKRDGMSFMPMLLMDAMNLLYEKYISHLPIKHEEKRIRTMWHDAYKHFIAEFFMPFNDDQKCEVCDIMNDFEEYIHNEIERFRVVVMNQFMQYDVDVRLVLSSTLACNVLAQSAQILWKGMRHRDNAYITSIESWSLKFLNTYADKRIDRRTREVDLNTFEPLRQASKRICNKILEFAEGLKF